MYWPVPSEGGLARLLVFFPAEDATRWAAVDVRCRDVCVRAGVVVLACARPIGISEETAWAAGWRVVGWAADHASELGVDPDRVLVAGEGFGARLAASVIEQAREYGWPPLTLVTLDQPPFADLSSRKARMPHHETAQPASAADREGTTR